VQTFQGGAIYTTDTGTRAVTAAFRTALGAVGSAWNFGFPTSDRTATPDGRGTYQHFGGGSVYSTGTTGTHALPMVFRKTWAGTGWERGPLGYPTTDMTTTPDGLGQFVHFEGGSVYSTRATGAHVLRGPVRDAWAAVGWERGVLGYPTTDVTVTPDKKGAYAYFQGGAVYWSPTTGARVLRGAVLDAWAGTGWEQGALGYPTSDTQAVAGGTRTDFQHGSIGVSTSTGKAVVTLR
jgi:uncharacterized protein with LGFP repeats